MPLISNDNTQLVPRTSFDGLTLEFDFPGMTIGVAEYEKGPTGCTVFHFPNRAAVSVDIRGGSTGTSETGYGSYDAICFSGGSLFGLEAAIGVRAELLAMMDYKFQWDTIPLVSGAIIWDWSGRSNAIYPDKELGRTAVKVAQPGVFPLGLRGAGRSAGCAGESSGQGGAFRQVGPTKIAVFTVVNSLGAIVNRQGQVVRGNLEWNTSTRRHSIDILNQRLAKNQAAKSQEPGNTTLTLVVTNQKLERRGLEQLGKQVHSSMARAIQPFHTINDGDVLYAATTNKVENESIHGSDDLGLIASELAWDAVLSCYQD